MKIYWSLRSVPELAQVPPQELADVVREAEKDPAVKVWSGIGLVASVLCAGLGFRAGDHLLWLHEIWGAAIGGGIGGLLFSQIRMHALARHFRKQAQRGSADVPMAP